MRSCFLSWWRHRPDCESVVFLFVCNIRIEGNGAVQMYQLNTISTANIENSSDWWDFLWLQNECFWSTLNIYWATVILCGFGILPSIYNTHSCFTFLLTSMSQHAQRAPNTHTPILILKMTFSSDTFLHFWIFAFSLWVFCHAKCSNISPKTALIRANWV